MGIDGELRAHGTVVVVVPGKKYNEVLCRDVAQISRGKKICYFTFNKTYQGAKELLEEAGVNTRGIFFVDGISKAMGISMRSQVETISSATSISLLESISRAIIPAAPLQAEGRCFISSPGSLTEISALAQKFISQKFDYLIFDSLTSMFVYQDKEKIGDFVKHATLQAKKGRTKEIFFAVEDKFVEKNVHVGKLAGKVLKR
ncbi:MAG: hypothetical protein NTV88_03010 [Candidatus Micrarchaeota archaeon]|nr:hypothetical protein [Candidatus Micrarchaeota archaeon]